MDIFKIKSLHEFICTFEKTEDEIISILNSRNLAYKKIHIKKQNGTREIYALLETHQLYKLQRSLNSFLQSILLPEAVYGFRKGKSYYDFLVPHTSKLSQKFFLRLDIADFFDSIDILDVKESLDYYISSEIEDHERTQILDYIIDIVSIENKIVQGAITSPSVSNIVFRSLDIRIDKYCQKFGVVYTRYADDLLFSSDSSYIHNYKFINAIQHIINTKSFKLNFSKTLKYKNEISLNGFVVGSNIRLSRKKLHRINKIVFKLKQSSFNGFRTPQEKYKCRNVLAGYRSFLIQSIKYLEDEKRISKTKRKISEIENLLQKIALSE